MCGNLGRAEVGKEYVMRLREDSSIEGMLGVKKDLLLRNEEGEDFGESGIRRSLALVGDGEVRFEVVP